MILNADCDEWKSVNERTGWRIVFGHVQVNIYLATLGSVQPHLSVAERLTKLLPRWLWGWHFLVVRSFFIIISDFSWFVYLRQNQSIMESPIQLALKPTIHTPPCTPPSSVLDEDHSYNVLGPPDLSLVFLSFIHRIICVNTSLCIRSWMTRINSNLIPSN